METVTDVIKRVKNFSQAEKKELIDKLLDDPEIREDLIDLALILEAESEESEDVTLEEFLAGKRTYDR